MKKKEDQHSDVRLWDRFRDGDTDAFSQIYNLHIQTLYQYGSKLLPDDTTLVMDCIHDLFVDLSNHRKTIGATDNIRFYLLRSLKNKIFRASKTLRLFADNYPFHLEAVLDDPLYESEFIKQKRRILRDALNKLPDRQKEAIYLRYINDFNNDEISLIMGINNQAVRNTLHKGIENLRKSISKEDFILFLMLLKKDITV